MASEDDVPEGSRAERILEAREAPAREAERARRRFDDPSSPSSDSPAARVLDRPGTSWATTAAGVACAVILHAGLVGVASYLLDTSSPPPPDDRPEIQHVVDLDRAPPPKPSPPEPEPRTPEPDDPPPDEPSEPAEPEPTPDPTQQEEPPDPSNQPDKPSKPKKPDEPDEPTDAPEKSKKSPKKESAQPAAAEAGEVLDSKSESGVADFTESSGDGTRYAGGVTASSGTSDEAVHDESATGGVDGDGTDDTTGDGGRSVGLDRSSWDCPWPDEAQDLSVDEQTVRLRAVVGPDGTPESVEIVSDPGFGFGDTAKHCAQSHTFRPALDDDGDPTTAESPPIRVRFTR